MSKSKLINSRKGPYGGFEMSEEKRKSITLSQLVLAIDGDDIYSNCALGLKKCNDLEPCPIHDQYKGIKADFKYMLENTTIEQLAQKLNQEKITLK
jgi:DNA-binding IscR family transcriptional regulator